MKIYWLGGLSFKIVFDNKTVVFEPIGDHENADYVFMNTDKKENHDLSKDGIIEFTKGDFEYSDEFIEAVGTYNPKSGNMIFKMSACGISIAHFGCKGNEIDIDSIKKMGKIDIAFLPIYSNDFNCKQHAKRIMDEIDINLVIPMVCICEGNSKRLGSIAEFLEMIKGEYDYSHIGKDYFETEKSELKKRTRVIIMQH